MEDFDDWNPDDPEQEHVIYDLSSWPLTAHAEVSAWFAERQLRHAWRGFEVVLPAALEDEADRAFDDLERRLGLGDDASLGEPLSLDDAQPLLEYELDTWRPAERATLDGVLVEARIPFRWEGDLLLVPAAAEEVVDELLNAVESGEFVIVGDDTESLVGLGELFLLARRLAREPRDPRAVAELASLVAVLDPERPPFGVQLSVWRRVVSLCQEMEALSRSSRADETAEIDLVERAESLHGLLRPLV